MIVFYSSFFHDERIVFCRFKKILLATGGLLALNFLFQIIRKYPLFSASPHRPTPYPLSLASVSVVLQGGERAERYSDRVVEKKLRNRKFFIVSKTTE